MPRTTAHVPRPGPALVRIGVSLRRWATGADADPADLRRRFDAVHPIDRFGDRIHLWLGALWCVCVSGPITAVELGMAPLLVCWLIRLALIRRRYDLRCLPLVWVAGAYGVWQALSLLWTRDVRLGLEELGTGRFMLAVLLLWPIIDRRRVLIAALAAGLLAAQLAQVAHAVGHAAGVEWLTFDRKPDRNSGWWQPVVGGSMLTAALGLHLPAAWWGSGRARALGLAGAAAAGLGVLATGSRGAWLASAGLVVVAGLVGARRLRGRAGVRRPVLLAAGVVLLAGAVAGMTLGDSIARRARAGWSEVAAAVRHARYDTDTGARIAMWTWAARAVAEHPLTGVGAGGYRAWVIERLAQRGIDPAAQPVHDHAHGATLHIAATLGVPGAALSAAVVGLGIVNGARQAAQRRPPGDRWAAYDAGPAFALLGLVLVSAFDTICVNVQTSALLAVLLALCPARVPAERSDPAPGRTP